jgi:hypothetical protein
MKKLIFLLIPMIILLFGCPTGEEGESGTQLTIQNHVNMGVSLDSVTWNRTSFGSISDNSEETRDVSAGSASIYFSLLGNDYRTFDTISVADDEQETYEFTGETIVVPLKDAGAPVQLQSVQ